MEAGLGCFAARARSGSLSQACYRDAGIRRLHQWQADCLSCPEAGHSWEWHLDLQTSKRTVYMIFLYIFQFEKHWMFHCALFDCAAPKVLSGKSLVYAEPWASHRIEETCSVQKKLVARHLEVAPTSAGKSLVSEAPDLYIIIYIYIDIVRETKLLLWWRPFVHALLSARIGSWKVCEVLVCSCCQKFAPSFRWPQRNRSVDSLNIKSTCTWRLHSAE